MKVSIHSLHWNNTSDIAEMHKEVTKHLNIKLNYHNLDGMRHGHWCNEIMRLDDADIIGFMDIDCIPTNRDIVDRCIHWVATNDSFVGLAQASNHIPPATHVFASPSFHFISKKCYEFLGNPSYLENERSDVAEEVSYVAIEKNKSYRAIYPLCYEKESTEGKWRLNNYGNFGIGTYYTGGIYNLFQGRYQENRELFQMRCKQIIDGTFTVEGMISSTEI